MNKKFIRKKVISGILSFVLILNISNPTYVSADTITTSSSGRYGNHTEHSEDCGYNEDVGDSSCIFEIENVEMGTPSDADEKEGVETGTPSDADEKVEKVEKVEIGTPSNATSAAVRWKTYIDPEKTELSEEIAGNFSDAVKALNSSDYGGTISLSKDVFITSLERIRSDITITGGGQYAIRRGGSYEKELFEVSAGGALELNEVTIDGGAKWGTGADYEGFEDTINRFVTNSGLSAKGAAVKITGGTVKLGVESVIQNNQNVSKSNGGAIHIASGTLTIDGGKILDNYSGASGGAVFMKSANSNVAITDGIVSGNHAGTNGGAFCVDGANLEISGGEIKNNLAEKAGGSIWTNGTVKMNGGFIKDSLARESGGGIHAQGNYTMTNGEILGNTAKQGAGVFVSGNFYIHGGSIKNNTALQLGGGAYVFSGTLEMRDGKIESNNSDEDGGGVYVKGKANFKMSGGLITENTATLDGNGIFDDGIFYLSGASTIQDNDIFLTERTMIMLQSGLSKHNEQNPINLRTLATQPGTALVYCYNQEVARNVAKSFVGDTFWLQANYFACLELGGGIITELNEIEDCFKDNLGLQIKDEYATEEQIEEKKAIIDSRGDLNDKSKEQLKAKLDEVNAYRIYLETNEQEVNESVQSLGRRGDSQNEQIRLHQELTLGNLDPTGYYVEEGNYTVYVYMDIEGEWSSDQEKPIVEVVLQANGYSETNSMNSLGIKNYKLKEGRNKLNINVERGKKPKAVYLRNNSTTPVRVRVEGDKVASTNSIGGTSLKPYPFFIFNEEPTDENFSNASNKFLEYVNDVKSYDVTNCADMTDIQIGKWHIASTTTSAKGAYENIVTDFDSANQVLKKVYTNLHKMAEQYNQFSGLDYDADGDGIPNTKSDQDSVNYPNKMMIHIRGTDTVTSPSSMFATNDYYHMPTSTARGLMSGNPETIYGWGNMHEFAHQFETRAMLKIEMTNNLYCVMGQKYNLNYKYRVQIDNSQKNVDKRLNEYLFNILDGTEEGDTVTNVWKSSSGELLVTIPNAYFTHFDYTKYPYNIYLEGDETFEGEAYKSKYNAYYYDADKSGSYNEGDKIVYSIDTGKLVGKYGPYGVASRFFRDGSFNDSSIALPKTGVEQGEGNRRLMALSAACGYNLYPYYHMIGQTGIKQEAIAYCEQFPEPPVNPAYYYVADYLKLGYTAESMAEGGVHQPFSPETKANIKSIAEMENGYQLFLDTSDKNDSVILYEIYRVDGDKDVLIGTTRTNTYMDTTVSVGDGPTYKVVAYDFALNRSIISAPLSVEILEPVAKIGDKEYKTLNAAVKAATNGQTIVVIADCNVLRNIEISGKSISIVGDGQGVHTIKRNMDKGNLFTISNNAGLTLGNSGAELILDGGSTVLDNSSLIQTGGRLTINSGITLQNSWNKNQGGAINALSQSVTIVKGAKIQNNKSTTGNGGAIHVAGSGKLYISDRTVIQNNSAGDNGGGIYGKFDENGVIEFSDSKITDNTAKNHGGGFWVSGRNTISSGEIINNTAGGKGGGVYMSAAAPENCDLNGGTISGNTASYGSGIYITGKTDLRINGAPVIGGDNALTLANDRFIHIFSLNSKEAVGVQHENGAAKNMIRFSSATAKDQMSKFVSANPAYVLAATENNRGLSLVENPSPVYTVTYQAGTNGTTADATVESVVSGGYPVRVPHITANTGYRFQGWSLDGNTIVDPTKTVITQATTFTALYEESRIEIDNMDPSYGDTLTVAVSTFPSGAQIHYQWKVGGINVGTDSPSYAVSSSDIGKKISVAVNAVGSAETLVSAETAAVSKKAVSAVAKDGVISKEYDGNNTAAVSLEVLVQDKGNPNDEIVIQVTNAVYENKNVGIGKTITLEDAVVSGSAAGWYEVTIPATVTGSIIAKTVVPSISCRGKTYDATDHADVTYSIAGLVSGDQVIAEGSGASYRSKDAGSHTVTAVGITLSGRDSSNYILSSKDASCVAVISPKVISFSADPIAEVIFNGTEQTPALAVKDGTDILLSGKDYEASYRNHINAGTANILLTGKGNYAGSTGTASFVIRKSAITALDSITIPLVKENKKTYSFDLSGIAMPQDAGSKSYKVTPPSDPSLFAVAPSIDTDGKTLTFTAEKVATVGKVSNVVVTIASQNYENAEVTITFEIIDKTPVTISGVQVLNKSYDGKAASYTGIPVAGMGNTKVEISEYDYVWAKMDGTLLKESPRKAGNYKLTVSVKGDHPLYMGSVDIPFSISKVSLTVKADDKEMYQYYNPLPKPTITYEGFVNGENQSVLTANTLTAGYAVTDSQTSGVFEISVRGSADSENYNIITKQGMLKIIENKVSSTAAEAIVPDTKLPAVGIPSSSMPSDVSDVANLKLVIYETTLEDQTALQNAISKKPGFKNRIALEIGLIDTANGNRVVQPKDKITISIPYPEDSSKKDDFKIMHLKYNGAQEEITPKKTETGLEFEVTSLSPFTIGWDRYKAGSSGSSVSGFGNGNISNTIGGPGVVSAAGKAEDITGNINHDNIVPSAPEGVKQEAEGGTEILPNPVVGENKTNTSLAGEIKGETVPDTSNHKKEKVPSKNSQESTGASISVVDDEEIHITAQEEEEEKNGISIFAVVAIVLAAFGLLVWKKRR